MSEEAIWYRDTGQLLEEIRLVDPETVQPTIEGYDELVEIGRGGQGVVYRARQRSTGRTVALKVLLEGAFASESSRRRFEREIELIAELHHPNVVQIYDSGATKDGRLFYSMEYVDGRSFDVFAEESRGGGESRDATLETFAKICDAVAHAHQRGVIHRDLKPSNVRIDAAGEPHVLDFGLAKPEARRDGENALTELSVTGQFIGSLPWASPELATGSASGLDVRTDVYALGMMLYQALTGRFPYEVSGVLREVLDTIARTEPARLSSVDRSIDDDLETIVLRCLAKEPGRRYQSATEVAREIRHYLAGEPIEAKRDSAIYTIRKTLARHRVASIAGAFGTTLLVVFAITMTVLYQRAAAAENLAEARLTELEAESNKVAVVNEYLLGAFSPRSGGADRSVQEMLDDAAARVETEIQGQPEVRAEVHYALSFWFSSYERTEEAIRQQELTHELRTEAYGEDNKQLTGSHQRLSFLKKNAGDLDGAIEHAMQWRRMMELYYSEHALTIANTYGWEAELRVRSGDAVAGEAAAREALRIRQENLEAGDPLVALTEGMLGITLAKQGKWDEADAMIAAGYASAEASWGESNGNVTWLRDFVNEVYAEAGRESPIGE